MHEHIKSCEYWQNNYWIIKLVELGRMIKGTSTAAMDSETKGV